MTDDELAMAYADGALGPIETKRFEARLEQSPLLAQAVASHRAVASRLRGGFAPIAAAPVPARFTALLSRDVVALHPAGRGTYRRAAMAVAMAACLLIGIAIDRLVLGTPHGVAGGPPRASGALARSLDRQLAGTDGATRMLVSFRTGDGRYCRVFATPAVDGIACRDDGGWVLRQRQAAGDGGRSAYRQAASPIPALLAKAQDLMVGDPLDSKAERIARANGWR